MTTLADVRDRIADMLSRDDLGPQITTEIQRACTRYSRKLSHLTETRGGIIATVPGQVWYDTIDLSAGSSYSDMTALTAVSVRQIVRIQSMLFGHGFARLAQFSEFECLSTDTGPGAPRAYVIHAGQIGITPVPVWDDFQSLTEGLPYELPFDLTAIEVSGGAPIYVSAFVKPVVPTSTDEESVWFDEAGDLIESAASAAVCENFTFDLERAAVARANEQRHYSDLLSEGTRKMATGRIKSHD